jgi:hypothetical protein
VDGGAERERGCVHCWMNVHSCWRVTPRHDTHGQQGEVAMCLWNGSQTGVGSGYHTRSRPARTKGGHTVAASQDERWLRSPHTATASQDERWFGLPQTAMINQSVHENLPTPSPTSNKSSTAMPAASHSQQHHATAVPLGKRACGWVGFALTLNLEWEVERTEGISSNHKVVEHNVA